MTVKRFTVPKNYRCIQDNLTKEHYLCEDKTEAINLAYLLNELSDENEQLKIQLQNTSDQRDEFHRGARENANRVGKLLEENEQLKSENKELQMRYNAQRELYCELNSNRNNLYDENEQLKQQINELKEDVPLLLAFYRWYPFAVEKKEHQAYNRLWDFVND